jgi:hypothetical protein
MLILGILYQLRAMFDLRSERDRTKFPGLARGESNVPAPVTLIMVVLLLIMGLLTAGEPG